MISMFYVARDERFSNTKYLISFLDKDARSIGTYPIKKITQNTYFPSYDSGELGIVIETTELMNLPYGPLTILIRKPRGGIQRLEYVHIENLSVEIDTYKRMGFATMTLSFQSQTVDLS